MNDCLKNFFEEEDLADNYMCEKCKKKSKAKKVMSLIRSPKYLVVHLKRFKMFPKKRKVTEKIKYPLENFSVEEY